MALGDTEVMRKEGNFRLLKIECKNSKISYCALGNGSTKHYEYYDDALEDFNLRWMKEKFKN